MNHLLSGEVVILLYDFITDDLEIDKECRGRGDGRVGREEGEGWRGRGRGERRVGGGGRGGEKGEKGRGGEKVRRKGEGEGKGGEGGGGQEKVGGRVRRIYSYIINTSNWKMQR